MKRTLLLLTILLLTTTLASAQSRKEECQNDGPNRTPCESASTPDHASKSGSRIAASSAASLSTMSAASSSGPRSSPIEPRRTTDYRFLKDGDGGLDSGCTFRSGGPLRFTIEVNRVVSTDVYDRGNLIYPERMVQNGIISEYATLRMPAFDVDINGGPPPEVDYVRFNGQIIGQLTGDNNVWKLNEFQVPISLIRFARPNPNGSGPEPGLNEIEIVIDQASGGNENWCTSIDWGELSFQAMYPVIMLHGNGSCGGFFMGDLECSGSASIGSDQYFARPFIQQSVPFDNFSYQRPEAPTPVNGEHLTELIPAIAKRFGVKHVHIVAHSKGGLHVRYALAQLKGREDIGVLSLSTLSTPHGGSVGADYVVDAAAGGKAVALFSDNRTRSQISRWKGATAGQYDLRVSEVEKFNQQNFPNLPYSFTVDGETKVVKYATIAADANLNNSVKSGTPAYPALVGEYKPTISSNELTGIPRIGPFGFGDATAMQLVYRLMGEVQYTTLEPRTKLIRLPGTLIPVPVTGQGIVEHRHNIFQLNDFLVTVRSAHRITRFANLEIFPPSFYTKANHASLSNAGVGKTVLDGIKEANSPR